MTRPAVRRHALYLLVVTNGPLILARGPRGFIAGRALVHGLWVAINRDHGLRQRDISVVEGLADDLNPTRDDLDVLPRLEAAFTGDPEKFARFHLYDWSEERGEFNRVREGREPTPGEDCLSSNPVTKLPIYDRNGPN